MILVYNRVTDENRKARRLHAQIIGRPHVACQAEATLKNASSKMVEKRMMASGDSLKRRWAKKSGGPGLVLLKRRICISYAAIILDLRIDGHHTTAYRCLP